MQRQNGSKLHFNDKFEQTGIDARMRQRLQQPHPATVVFGKLHGGQWRCELVIFDGELHRIAGEEIEVLEMRARLSASSFGMPSAAKASRTNAIFVTG
jgi:hypothetical protein